MSTRSRKPADVSGQRSPRAWIGVVSRSHVQRGVAGGFAQLCHGKSAPLARMQTGDWLIYYSPRTDYPDGAPLKAFTAIGRIAGEQVYLHDMGGGFVPHRRDVTFIQDAKEVPIAELVSTLRFIREHPNWGMLARRGHFEIGMDDLVTIAETMGAAERMSMLRHMSGIWIKDGVKSSDLAARSACLTINKHRLMC